MGTVPTGYQTARISVEKNHWRPSATSACFHAEPGAEMMSGSQEAQGSPWWQQVKLSLGALVPPVVGVTQVTSWRFWPPSAHYLPPHKTGRHLLKGLP